MSETKTNAPAIFFPKDFYCPITLELFQNPYIGPSNLTFEYNALVSHFGISDKHPITRVKCALSEFGPNISLRNSIQSMQEEYAKRNITVTTKLPSIEKGGDSLTFTKTIAPPNIDGMQTGIVSITNTADQPGTDITIIIDYSGSMGASAALKGSDGHKRENGLSLQDVTNASAIAVLESLCETDRVSVIKYNSNVTVLAPLTFATSAFKKEMASKIKAIYSGGQTNIWGAVKQGLEQYRDNSVSGRKQTIILLTDGRPNVCPARGEKHALNSWYKQHPDQNIDIHTVGFGNAIDSELLMDLATVGRGTYNFLSSPDMIGTIFVNLAANCLSSSCAMPTIDLQLTVGNKFAASPIPGMTSQVARLSDTHIRIKCPRLKCNAPFSLAFELDPSNKKITAADITVSGIPSMVESGSEENTWGTIHTARNAVIKGIDKINNYQSMGSYAEVATVYSDTLKELQHLGVSVGGSAVKPLIEDWTKQVKEAANLSTQHGGQLFWQTWGKHWLKSLKMAHMYQYTNNFRDPGIQDYGKNCTLFEILQDNITKIFDTLPPPEPSKYVAPEMRCRSMTAYNNPAYDGCFDGDCKVLVQPNDPNERPFEAKVRYLKKGDKVVTSMNDIVFKTIDTVECVVRTRCTSKENGISYAKFRAFDDGLLITDWHPVLDEEGFHQRWKFPAEMKTTEIIKNCEYVYDVVLTNRSSTLVVNTIQVATLGHGLKGAVIGHEYFGDRIIADLKKLDGYDSGLVTTNGFKRNTDSGLIDGLID